MTIEELEKVKFKFHSHMSMEDEHTTTYFSEDGKIGFCNHVPFKNGEPHGRSYRHYWLNGKVYKSKKKFLEAIKDYNHDRRLLQVEAGCNRPAEETTDRGRAQATGRGR